MTDRQIAKKMLKLGTRGSKLALAQAEVVRDAVTGASPEIEIEIQIIKTLGDRKQGTPEAANSDKRDWVEDLEEALTSGEIDFAVHSGKDIPAEIANGTRVASVLERKWPSDIFIGKKLEDGTRLPFSELRPGDLVGTASLRRKALLRRLIPGINVQDHRGNVPTRLRKLDDSEELSGIILAQAGLERLRAIGEESISDVQYEALPPEAFLPALCQGTLAVQYRSDDTATADALVKLSDPEVEASFLAERRCAQILDGDCRSAISIYASHKDLNQLSLSVAVYSHDGVECIESSQSGEALKPSELGEAIGAELLEKGARELLERCSNP